ncbi:MAG: amino acid ABC transporter permease [Bosea sp.]|uniref:amino acid ABC transporter permease n=1 Tax=Bosea sp. (in: a-proteobacteria) TaxID=1871050 RepID=UPI001AC8AAF1|nr:amino acid ABC transporter permease [Bosea sp. (in: a-proteobacteria)]MBN9451554.1 amino acid ABC transporter permease [Bosea sp. (in: a-proteobacteria)]
MLDQILAGIVSIYNYRIVAQYVDEFMRGGANTIMAAAASLALSIALGFLVALTRLYGSRILTAAMWNYTQIIRSTPLLIQIYIVYFGLPLLIPPAGKWPEIVLGIIALTIHTTPYMAEIIRSGIVSVPRGQREGAIALGLSPAQQYRLVILPQAFAKTLPPLLGQAAILVKDTSLLSLITVFDILSAGMLLNSERIKPNEGFLSVAIIYLLIYLVLLVLSRAAQRRLAGGVAGGRAA